MRAISLLGLSALLQGCHSAPSQSPDTRIEKSVQMDSVDFRIPLERVEHGHSAATYCTISQSGTYDIVLKNGASEVLAVIERICINYSEPRGAGESPKFHILYSNYTGGIKSSNITSLVQLRTEFMQAASERTRLHMTIGYDGMGLRCGMKPQKFTSNTSEPIPGPNPTILPNAHPNGFVHLRYSYSGIGC